MSEKWPRGLVLPRGEAEGQLEPKTQSPQNHPEALKRAPGGAKKHLSSCLVVTSPLPEATVSQRRSTGEAHARHTRGNSEAQARKRQLTCEAHARHQRGTLDATAKHRRGYGEETMAVALLMTYLCLVLQTLVACCCRTFASRGISEANARHTRGAREALARRVRHRRDRSK